MPAPAFKIIYEDGTSEEFKLRPRAQIDFEEETGEALASIETNDMKVSKLYRLAWFAAGKPGDFDEWIDNLDSVESVETEGGDDTRPTSPDS